MSDALLKKYNLAILKSCSRKNRGWNLMLFEIIFVCKEGEPEDLETSSCCCVSYHKIVTFVRDQSIFMGIRDREN